MIIVFSFITLFIPLIDFAVSGGAGIPLLYAVNAEGSLHALFSMGGIIGNSVITPGQAVIIWVTIFLLFIYIRMKNCSASKAVIALGMVYLMGIFSACFPFFIVMALSLGPSITQGVSRLIVLFLLSLGLIQSIIWLYFYNRRITKSFFRNLKLSRAAHYLILALLGVLFALHTHPNILLDYTALFVSLLLVLLTFEFCLVHNNISDREIPKKINQGEYETIGIGMLLFLLGFAAMANVLVVSLLFVTIVFGLYYSVPPFRLKRFGWANNIVIGFISMLVFGVGFFSQSGNWETMQLNVWLAIFITFSLAANIKDLKDYEADKKQGIKTLPVLLGKKKGLEVIAFLSSVSFVIPPALLGFPNLTIIGMLFGALNYLLLSKTKRERATFTLYFAFGVIFGLSLLFGLA